MLPFPGGSFFPGSSFPPGMRFVAGMPGIVPTMPLNLAQQNHAALAQAQVSLAYGRELQVIAARQAQAAQAVAAAQMQQPMLVPQGMGDTAVDNAVDSPRSNSPWATHKTDDGRVFYYNKVTRQSTWTKPDELKTPAEVLMPNLLANTSQRSQSAGKWRSAMSENGRKYYYNTETKETSWVLPEGAIDTTVTDTPGSGTGTPVAKIPVPDATPVKTEKEEKSEMEKAMAATLASIEPPEDKNSSDVPMVDEEQELKKRQADLFRELLRDKYNDGKITSTDSWDAAVRHIQSDSRFRVLTKVSEKKQLFNAWKVQRQKEERDEKRLAVKKAKEDLEKWLQDQPKMKTNIRYQKAAELFEKEPIWKAVADSDRREIFSDVHAFVQKRETELAEKTRKRNIQVLSDILEGMRQITYRTTWAQAQRLLIENPAFADDITLQSMDKEDALIVFEDFIRAAEKAHEIEKESEERRLKRQERKVREAFQALLEELHAKGSLHSMSLWSSFYPQFSTDPRFDAMLMQTGSTPLDLFKFYVFELKEQYSNHRRLIKDILAAQGNSIQSDTTYDQLVEWVQADERGKKVDAGNMKLCFHSLIEKAESKLKEAEREETRKKKRQEGEFRNLLRTLQPPVGQDTDWASVRSKIENEEAFKVIEDEETREQFFKDYVQQVGDACGHVHSKKKKKDKKNKKEKNDSESESDEERAKKKKRSRETDDEDKGEKKKKKKRRHSRSRSRSKKFSDSE